MQAQRGSELRENGQGSPGSTAKVPAGVRTFASIAEMEPLEQHLLTYPAPPAAHMNTSGRIILFAINTPGF